MRLLAVLAGLAVLTPVHLPVDANAMGSTCGLGRPWNLFSIGAAYERYSGDWESDNRAIGSGTIDQARFYLQGCLPVAGRWAIQGRIGIADMSANEFADDSRYKDELLEDGFQVFGSLELSAAILGAPRDSAGSALDLALEISGFGPHEAEIEDYLYTITGDVPVSIKSKITEHWEGRFSVLLRRGSARHSVSFGPSLMRSGARCQAHVDAGYAEETWVGYIENTHEIALTVAYRLRFWRQAAVEIRALWSPSTYTRIRLSF
jgi:hypothetical protein